MHETSACPAEEGELVVPGHWGHPDSVLDDGPYATLVFDEVQGTHLVIDTIDMIDAADAGDVADVADAGDAGDVVDGVRRERPSGADALTVRVDEFLQLDDPLEDVTEWDPTWLFPVLDTALRAAGHRIDLERPARLYDRIAVSRLPRDDARR
jgi:hypothetical protein